MIILNLLSTLSPESIFMLTMISKRLSDESVYDTQQQLLEKPAMASDSLLFLLIGNIITSVVKSHSTPLQIALGVYSHRKKTMMHMSDYLVGCSYDEVL